MVFAKGDCHYRDRNLDQNLSLPVKHFLTPWRRGFLRVSVLFCHFVVLSGLYFSLKSLDGSGQHFMELLLCSATCMFLSIFLAAFSFPGVGRFLRLHFSEILICHLK